MGIAIKTEKTASAPADDRINAANMSKICRLFKIMIVNERKNSIEKIKIEEKRAPLRYAESVVLISAL
ncbi:hypothetical protein IPdc08_01752 [archaeon]|nr:hypothetical protein IPdc08_01752 [archaeon]